jgi:hypothetical protein
MDLTTPSTTNAKQTHEEVRTVADRMDTSTPTGDRFVVVRLPLPTEGEHAHRRREKQALVLGGIFFVLLLLVLGIMIRHAIYVWSDSHKEGAKKRL